MKWVAWMIKNKKQRIDQDINQSIMPRVFRSVLLALFVFVTQVFSTEQSVFITNVYAQVNTAVDSSAVQDNRVTLNLQDVDIRILINTVAEISGKNFIIDPRVKGKVSVVSGGTLTPEQLYDVFLSILEVHNFAAVDSGSVIKILPSNVIKQRPTPTEFSPTGETNDAQLTQIIQLTHASVQDLVPIIRPLIPPTSHFAPHTPSNSIVLTDTAANIQRVLKIIARIDVPDKRSNVHVVYLEQAKASDLANTLTQLVASSGVSSGNPKVVTTAKVTIQPIDAINALVISSPDEDFTKIQALITELDIERTLDADINVIYLKHAKAEDLVSILNDVTANSTAGGVSEFSVQADEATNSLIVKASSGQLRTVQSVVDKLDIRRAQVFVETVIAEVSLDQAAALGVKWGAGGPITSESSTTTTTGTGDSATTATSTSSSSLGNIVNKAGQAIGTATIGTAFNIGEAGLNYSLLNFKKYQLDVIINAIRSDSNSNILSTPTLLTLDNETAEIVVGQEVPFITGRYNNGNNTTINNGNDGSSNVSSNQFQTIERKDVGIKLKVKPRISDGDTIQLEISQEISSVADTLIDGQADLITNRRSIEAVVQVDDGQVVVLGGLIQDDVIDTVEWVPFFGKIPVIGHLFRSKRKTAVKRNLMVFLKPRIVRSAEDLRSFSKAKYDEVRRDGQFSRLNSSDFLIKGAEPPVLVEYDSAINEGTLQSERRREDSAIEYPNQKPDNKLLFWRKGKANKKKNNEAQIDKLDSANEVPNK